MKALVVVFAALLVAGCSSSDDERTVAGRSSSQAASVTSVELAARVERTRTRDAATGLVVSRVRVEARATGLTRATLRAPSGAEAPLEGTSDLVLEADDAGSLGGAGQYAVLGALAGGAAASCVVVVGDVFPEAPAITGPVDGAIGVSLQPTVVWSGGGGRTDVRVIEASTGRVVHTVSDVLDTTWRVPAGALAARTRYRLEVHACDVAAGSAARLAAGTSVTFETGAAP